MKPMIKFRYSRIKRPDGHFHRKDCAAFVIMPEWLREGEDMAQAFADNGYVVGIAYCNPCDQFEVEKGRKLALARAIQGLTREDRRRVWSAYWTMGEKPATIGL